MRDYAEIIAQTLGLKPWQVKNTIELLSSGATVPFISRYRKEATDSLDEVQVSKIGELNTKWIELDKRRAAIVDSITEQGKMTEQLREEIENALTMSELEDIYLPYKPKRKTRATIAMDKGLEPLARRIYDQQDIPLKKLAASFINKEKGVENEEDAIAGARDIIAEWICENKRVRERMRTLFMNEAAIHSKVLKDKEKDGEKYENFFEFSEPLRKAPSHRILAMFRGENEGFLKVTVFPDEEKALDILKRFIIRNENDCARQVWKATTDSYKRLLQPQMETEVRDFYKEKADKEAINVFVNNLRQLLMSPPLGQKRVLAIDPGFRTGCKIVILNEQGKLLHNETIYPHPPQAEYKLASDKLKRLVLQYKIEAIAIGNGTAGRETENFVRKIPFERDVMAIVVNESGASVYSASAVAREEFPDYDVTVRGAVSIGRRLMDPLAELVKVDPKSIGVGQYQHDVNQVLLRNSLEETVISCVNKVGVEVNTASKELLSYVSGVGPVLAKNIVEYRNQNGPFADRKSLMKVARFGNKAFEQAAGFLRIHAAENPLDSSAVHPESYHIVDEMAKRNHCSVKELIANEAVRKNIDLKEYTTEKVGLPTLKDIIEELAKPGRDPRAHFDVFEFDKSIHSINDLVEGMVVPGIVTNITNFGCFVDIGVHQDGLVHISQLANRYVSDPNDVVKLNQKVMVKVVGVDVARKRINLSMKEG
ncbi:RNA-binding transcriptional accessory protein [Bacteroidales bacterium OttesenSCG-928-B11]|nr:RNA-binding transcriptional accessory protein [Bacteroidales bacterium OttesenSCG-928-E04]MDL2309048.1 RNA-binding transcriptional accessory protein [Bacteroidales bacterium OttesenSCG-928-C03]MDL2312266.1 RNA-binding transcriptional accessory protein [Bacteroidales bacterium OttesenSCG-928-B11]